MACVSALALNKIISALMWERGDKVRVIKSLCTGQYDFICCAEGDRKVHVAITSSFSTHRLKHFVVACHCRTQKRLPTGAKQPHTTLSSIFYLAFVLLTRKSFK
ncbi:hypothetical protein XELAEV_18033647mg [Xenopus laevis]|uniref:Uncharacterized protein n=1 Tax=Xenopus laevis TaxID=8355 RepID=A0A974HE66_XENLA|nr:hypothetical protein XELAEV_18033647mg [Xenopus laevis]